MNGRLGSTDSLRYGAAAVVALLFAAASLAACRGLGSAGGVLQQRASPTDNSTADARRSFDHRRHEAAFGAAGVLCIDCHRFDQSIGTADPAAARAISAHGLNPGSGACHGCHLDGVGATAAPNACSTCHDNLAPLLPDDHRIAWMRVHASAARNDPARCETCHRQAQCIDCHQRRDDIQTRVHDRNFRFTHSIIARANPMQCGSCHRPDYCSNCHQQGQSGLP